MNFSPTVFVIDDEEPIRTSFAALLEVLSINVQTFASAQMFLDSYAADWTGCVFVDLRMPSMSGLDLVNELRRRGSRLLAVAMTGHGDEELIQKLHDAGVVEVLEKPFSVARLKEVLQSHLPTFCHNPPSGGA